MLIFKGLPGTNDPYVKIDYFNHKTSLLLETANDWSHQFSNRGITINAVDNGVHENKGTTFTFHGLSMAWDLGVVGILKVDLESLVNYLRMRLPYEYEVVLKADHIHVEWDTKRGR